MTKKLPGYTNPPPPLCCAPTECFTRRIKLRTKVIHNCTVLDVLVLVKLEVSINDSLVLNDFNANKFLSVSCFKRSSYSKTTPDLVEKKTVSSTCKHQCGLKQQTLSSSCLKGRYGKLYSKCMRKVGSSMLNKFLSIL